MVNPWWLSSSTWHERDACLLSGGFCVSEYRDPLRTVKGVDQNFQSYIVPIRVYQQVDVEVARPLLCIVRSVSEDWKSGRQQSV